MNAKTITNIIIGIVAIVLIIGIVVMGLSFFKTDIPSKQSNMQGATFNGNADFSEENDYSKESEITTEISKDVINRMSEDRTEQDFQQPPN